MRGIAQLLAGACLLAVLSLKAFGGDLQTSSVVCAGVKCPAKVQVDGRDLSLNGIGVRELNLLGVRVKFYVASFYTARPLRSPEEVQGELSPMRLDMTFLKTIDRSLVASTWRKEFAAHPGHSYRGLRADEEKFITLLGDLDAWGRDTVLIFPGETRVLDRDKIMGVIHGGEFRKILLDLLFGENPISRRLKVELLRGVIVPTSPPDSGSPPSA